MARHFCTYFDINYLSRGLALYESLRRHCPAFELYVLCMDDAAHAAVARFALPGVRPIKLADLESNDPALVAAKSNRSRIEYYFTCTPAFTLYLMQQDKDIDVVTYLDADLFFFSNPDPLFEELGTHSVGIIEHRFPAHLMDREKYGRYNVGWVSFRRDEGGITALTWWRDRCLEWCYDRVEGNRFADQKYLDDWPTRFSSVAVLNHPGANLAPWNIDNHEISSSNGKVTVDSQPLIFFHFHGLKQIGRWLYDPGWKEYRVRPSRLLRTMVYLPYIRVLRQAASLPGGVRASTADSEPSGPLRRVKSRIRRFRSWSSGIAAGELIVCVRSGKTVNMADSA